MNIINSNQAAAKAVNIMTNGIGLKLARVMPIKEGCVGVCPGESLRL